jgi:hypothetical protein
MEPVQPGGLFPLALVYVMVLLPIFLWQGYHWMHTLDESHHDEHNGDQH